MFMINMSYTCVHCSWLNSSVVRSILPHQVLSSPIYVLCTRVFAQRILRKNLCTKRSAPPCYEHRHVGENGTTNFVFSDCIQTKLHHCWVWMAYLPPDPSLTSSPMSLRHCCSGWVHANVWYTVFSQTGTPEPLENLYWGPWLIQCQ